MKLIVVKGRHLTTEHGPNVRLNDVNPGFYWQFLFVAWGIYRNSHSTSEKVLLSRWFGFVINLFGSSYSFGLVSGYPDVFLLPYFSRSETLKVGRTIFRLFFVPETPLNGAAIHGGVEEHASVKEIVFLLKKVWQRTVNKNKISVETEHEFRDSRIADYVDLARIEVRFKSD